MYNLFFLETKKVAAKKCFGTFFRYSIGAKSLVKSIRSTGSNRTYVITNVAVNKYSYYAEIGSHIDNDYYDIMRTNRLSSRCDNGNHTNNTYFFKTSGSSNAKHDDNNNNNNNNDDNDGDEWYLIMILIIVLFAAASGSKHR